MDIIIVKPNAPESGMVSTMPPPLRVVLDGAIETEQGYK